MARAVKRSRAHDARTHLGSAAQQLELSREAQADGAHQRRLARAVGSDDHVEVRARAELHVIVRADREGGCERA